MHWKCFTLYYTGYQSSSSLSTAAVVTITILITMVISIALTTIVMLIIFKLYLLKRSQHSQHVHPPKTEVPSLKVKDIKEESNPAYKITEDDDSHRDAYELYYWCWLEAVYILANWNWNGCSRNSKLLI